MKFIKDKDEYVAVPAVFLKDYICDAPPEYVKVYLFGLYLAQFETDADIIDLEDKLHLSKDRIDTALSYWSKKGFVQMSGGEVRFAIPENKREFGRESAMTEQKSRLPECLYEKAEYNSILNKLLNRTLTHSQLQTIYDFTDVFKLPESVVISMVEHCVTVKGSDVGIAYLDKVAKSWAEKGVSTLKDAQIQIDEYNAATGGAKKIMKRMGLFNKLPGAAELEYYEKWTKEWGFAPDAILCAMKNTEFSSINQPFKYLDGILAKLKEKGTVKTSQIFDLEERNKKERAEIKEITKALSSGGRSADFIECREFFKKWNAQNIDKEVIMCACRECAGRGIIKPSSADRLIEEWIKSGLDTKDKVEKYLSHRSSFESLMKDAYAKAGITKKVGTQDIRLCETLLNKYQMERGTLLFAAEISGTAADPYYYFKKVLHIWAQNGIKTLEEAKQRDESVKAALKPAANAKPGFAQREFDEKAEKERRIREMLKEGERINALKTNS